jgi:hypothetical protein
LKQKIMPRKLDNSPMAGLEKLVTSLPAADYALNISIVYDHAQSRKWAGDVYRRVEDALGIDSVKAMWWNVCDLAEPGVLAGAVSTAIRADMIIIAVQGSEGLPLPFYFWINSWMPHRVPGAGALVALVGSPFPRNTESGRLQKFLRTVARRARMELLVSERAEVYAGPVACRIV